MSSSRGLQLLFAGALLAHVNSASGQLVTEFSIPTADSYLGQITHGADGNPWFTEEDANQIGRITPDGVVTEFSLPTPASLPTGITPGPDGNLWFTEASGDRIGRITPTGAITEFPLPTSMSSPNGIVTGPDGNLWFAETQGDRIGRITLAGVITELPLPESFSAPASIVVGPDGNLWFTEVFGNRIGKITMDGVVAEFPVPTQGSWPYGIAAGSDGGIWFTEMLGEKIGRISITDGAVSEVVTLPPNSTPAEIVRGPDDQIWFTEGNANRIGRIGATGALTEFPVPTADSGPASITLGPDGNLWFTELLSNKIGRITTGATGPCTANTTTLCLNGGRFELRVAWRVPPEGRSGPGTAVPLTGDTGYFWFFGQDNVELIVKALDGRALNGYFWIFYGALTNVQYTVTVRDTVTGAVENYENPYGTLASVADTSAFGPEPASIAPALPIAVERIAPSPQHSSSCVTGGPMLCLNQSRFQLTVDWEVPSQGRSGHGTAASITNDTGHFWFFNENNVELVIKVLDGRALNGHHWVFYGALSDVQYRITVTDTETQTVKIYTNPSGTLASVADTTAF